MSLLCLVDGVEHDTFHAAAVAMGVAQDDREWELCLQEAVAFKSAAQLRHLFAILLLWSTPAKPVDLFLKFVQVWRDRMNGHCQTSTEAFLLAGLHQRPDL